MSETAVGSGLSAAERDVLAERRRQIEVEGFGSEHDDAQHDGDLALAAATYAAYRSLQRDTRGRKLADAFVTGLWPWPTHWWKPRDRRRDLVRAAALLIAEIERLDRTTDRLRSRRHGA